MSTFHIKVGKDQLPERLHSVLSTGQWKSPKTSYPKCNMSLLELFRTDS